MDGTDGITIALGATTTGLVVKELLAWLRSRNQRTAIEPDPLRVEKQDKFVTRGEFNKHVEDNARDHENLFGRLNRNDRETSEIKGMLSTIIDDLRSIKNFMMARGSRQ